MKFFFLALTLTFSGLSMATVAAESICSKLSSVCAAYRSDLPFTTTQEGRFALYLQSNSEIEAELVKVDLWMQMGNHGHGSSPLTVRQVAPGEFDVTKAYFVMQGQWQIRVKYKQGSVEETLIIPIMVKQWWPSALLDERACYLKIKL